MERLTFRAEDGRALPKDGCHASLRKAIDRLAYYEDMEEQGRLVVLPCKVGDTVYILDGDYYDEELYVEEHKVVGLTLSDEHEWYFFVNECLGQHLEPFEACDIGKTVFLTREEAEQALKGGAET